MSDFNTVVHAFSSSVDQAIGDNRNPKAYIEALQYLASSSMAESTRFRQLMNDSLENQVAQYNNTSANISKTNLMYTNNMYINSQLSVEQSKLNDMAKELKKKIYNSKQKIQQNIYFRNRTLFIRSVVMFSTLLVLFLMWTMRMGMQGFISDRSMYILMGVACAVFASFMSWYMVWSTYRRNYDWTKFHWLDPKPSDYGTCPAAKA